jgi:hypothetical protein
VVSTRDEDVMTKSHFKTKQVRWISVFAHVSQSDNNISKERSLAQCSYMCETAIISSTFVLSKKDSRSFLTVAGPLQRNTLAFRPRCASQFCCIYPRCRLPGGCNGAWFPLIISSAFNCVDVDKRFASLSLSAATTLTAAMT